MKKVVLLTIVFMLVLSTVSTCLAFPAAGKYESETILLYPEPGYERYGSLWSLEIQMTDHYSGSFLASAKGAWVGEWTAPLSLPQNSQGRYAISINNENRWTSFELEENSDGSVTVYLPKELVTPKCNKVTLQKVK
ncbi:hypothetical protein SPSIL_051560 [Sporomusa silvacetica DSM 10669]|uniref:Uncharacterized protein n=1 Tax=Sporomusa silvacetica DSM 10669 TaxID=1123289 RepID=A0ABZ3IU33_9FIRM|nr:hypothetical protein [Sporomusa silvacetica]OZC19787.1 hypothetical protein SPSIL_19140 [Sporomusa silvacetica DSM 10669]